jgi:hypothetical protein
MDHKTLFAGFEQEVRLEKQRENFLKARNILSDKQNSTANLKERFEAEQKDEHIIAMAFQSFILAGDLDKFMTAIKDTNYFGKR